MAHAAIRQKGPCRTRPGSAARRRGLALVLSGVLCVATPGMAVEVRLRHTPTSAASAWQPLAIEVALVGEVVPERVLTADVVVAGPSGNLRPVPLTVSANALFGEIPGALVRPPAVSYYLRLVDDEGTVSVLPPGSPEAGLFRVPVAAAGVSAAAPGAAGGAAGKPREETVEILSPMPGAVVTERRPEIAGLIDPPMEEPWEALLLLDGRDAGEGATIAADLFLLVPPDSLSDGQHRVTFSALTATRRVESSWVFFVGERSWEDVFDEEWALSPGGIAPLEPSAGPTLFGRIEVGWAVVAAQTTAVETVDVFLAYEETSRPTIDLYASGRAASGSYLVTAHYHPVYDERLQWLLGWNNEKLEVEAGDVFPSLSATTLDWASGLGGRLVGRLGRSRTELVGLRMTEADTLGGFGLYSRFALGAKETVQWTESVAPSIVLLHVFDREGSVPEEQRLADPLRNTVAAAMVRTRGFGGIGEFEYARSHSEGETEGDGNAVRARVGIEKDFDNRVFVEYIYNDSSFYSAGSFEHAPGERGAEVEFTYRPTQVLRGAGLVGTYRALDASRGIDPGENQLRLYGRLDAYGAFDGWDGRAYVVGKYDRTPYVSYDYVHRYGLLGGSGSWGRLRSAANLSWSRTWSPASVDLWTIGGDLRYEIVPGRWTARGAARWSVARLDDGETDYERAWYSLESRWFAGGFDLEVEYWLIDLDDREEPVQSYREHVLSVSIGRSL